MVRVHIQIAQAVVFVSFRRNSIYIKCEVDNGWDLELSSSVFFLFLSPLLHSEQMLAAGGGMSMFVVEESI